MPANQKQGAAELVKRARLYDQNAMGMLATMAENAKSGDPTAISGLSEVKRYIESHPTDAPLSDSAKQILGVLREPGNPPGAVTQALTALPRSGCKDDIFAACVILALCQPVSDDSWVAAAAESAGPAKDVMLFAVENAGDEDLMEPAKRKVGTAGIGPLCAGHCIGMARRIQAAAEGDVSALGSDIGWELGCT